MESKFTKITIEALVKADIQKVWDCWVLPRHIIRWCFASDDWQAPYSENDLKVGGKFTTRMEAKDGSFGFDFGGIYEVVENLKHIKYKMEDEREVEITFTQESDGIKIIETFDAESENSIEMQRDGWQMILNNFKKYVEDEKKLELMTYTVEINAPAEKVFKLMLEDAPYREWTAIFNPTSYYEGQWSKGSKMLFLGTAENGEKGGMVSRIKECIENKFVSIEHLGVVEGTNEITTGEKVESWAGSMENYTFEQFGNSTKLTIDLDTNQEYKDYFSGTYPNALAKLKEICER